MNTMVMNKKRVLSLKTVCICLIIIFSSFFSFKVVKAGYVEAYKQFNVGSSGGTYNNSKSFSGGGGAGTATMSSRITVKSGVKYLTNITLTHKVTQGNPYYSLIYADSKGSGLVYFPLNEKFLKKTSLKSYSMNMKNPTSTTTYLMTDLAGAAGKVGVQYRYVSIFKY